MPAALWIVLLLLLVALAAGGAWWWFGSSGAPPLPARRAAIDGSVEPSPLAAPASAERSDAHASDPGEKSAALRVDGAPGSDREPTAEAADPTATLLGSLSGRVLDAASRHPLAGAEIVRVDLESDERNEHWWRFHRSKPRAVADANGEFVIADLRADEPLWVGVDGYPWTRLDLAPPATAGGPTEVLLSPGGRLRARVRDSAAAPVAGVKVTVRSEPQFNAAPSGGQKGVTATRGEWELATAEDGEATFLRLPPFRALAASLDPTTLAVGAAPTADGPKLRLGPGEEVVREWRIGGGVALRGRLVDQRGVPLGSAHLWLARVNADLAFEVDGRVMFRVGDDAQIAASAFTDQDGRFAFPPLPPGRHVVGPSPWNRESVGLARGDLVPQATPVELRDGRVAEEIVLSAEVGLFLRGEAIGPREEPVAGRLVATRIPEQAVAGFDPDASELGSFAGGERPEVTAVVAQDGRFIVGPLAAGHWTVLLEPASTRFARVRSAALAAGSDDVKLRVPLAARLEVACIAPDGAEIAARFVVVRQDREGVAWLDGRARGGGHDDVLDGLLAGSFAVGATTDEGLAGVLGAITLAEGEARRVEVPLERGGFVELHLPATASDRATVSCRSGGIVAALVELQAGARLLVALPQGQVQLRATIGSKPWGRDLELRVGERIEVGIEP
jgi:hypothetical protein